MDGWMSLAILGPTSSIQPLATLALVLSFPTQVAVVLPLSLGQVVTLHSFLILAQCSHSPSGSAHTHSPF